MKLAILFIFGFTVAAVTSLPALHLESDTGVPLHEIDPIIEGGLRYKRATCDGGSFESLWFTPKHSLCAAHCLLKRYKGGYCKDLICHCRDKF